MKSPLLLAASAALFALAACNNAPKTPEVLDTNPDPMAAELANRAPVELPPSIKADKSMRCQPGNILLYVTFFDGDKLAIVRTEKGGAIDAPDRAGRWRTTHRRGRVEADRYADQREDQRARQGGLYLQGVIADPV